MVDKKDALAVGVWIAVNIIVFAVKYVRIAALCNGEDLESFSFIGTTDYACQTVGSCCKEGTDPHGKPCSSDCMDPCNAFSRAIGHNIMLNMALTLLPILKNSPLVKLPYIGEPFERTVHAHRYLGFAIFVMMVLHMLGWWTSYPPVSPGWLCWSWTFGLRSDMFLGHMAFLCHAVQAFFALEWFRRRYYELFYHTHLLFIPIYVFAIWHSFGVQQYTFKTMFDGGDDYFLLYLMIPAGLYFIDRAIRLYHFFVPSTLMRVDIFPPSFVGETKMENLPNAACMKITIKREMKFEPGQYCWLYVPSVGPFEWHPISISSSPQLNRHSSPESSVTFHIKSMGKGTWTGKLFERGCKAVVDKAEQFSILLDGPYGKPSLPMEKYSTLVFISGGVGVTPMMSMLTSLIHEPDRYPFLQRVHFHWSIKETDQIDWFAAVWLELFPVGSSNIADAAHHSVVKTDGGVRLHLNGVDYLLQFHVSDLAGARNKEKARSSTLNNGNGATAKYSSATATLLENAAQHDAVPIHDPSQSLFQDLPRALFSAGRPSARNILRNVIEEQLRDASVPTGNVMEADIAVYTCGPAALMDSVGDECKKQSTPTCRFLLHRETFAF